MDSGVKISVFDPFVRDWTVDGREVERFDSVKAALEGSNLVVIVQAHDDFLDQRSEIEQAKTLVLDATGKFQGRNIERL
jgi:UDP-N-acetyl-D-mannosaminuronate dehydrogenase